MHENYDLDLLLELVEQRKFRSLKELLSQMNEVDIAEFLDELDVEQEILVFRLLPKDTSTSMVWRLSRFSTGRVNLTRTSARM